MKARNAIVNDNNREIVIGPWDRQKVANSLNRLQVIEITDEDYRTVYLPCAPMEETGLDIHPIAA